MNLLESLSSLDQSLGNLLLETPNHAHMPSSLYPLTRSSNVWMIVDYGMSMVKIRKIALMIEHVNCFMIGLDTFVLVTIFFVMTHSSISTMAMA